ncbi:MAG: hypothetical protein OXC11_13515 [Rhodospirillales bacterium]|nr:hypothetical protein [Rhodospirillales bacterium]
MNLRIQNFPDDLHRKLKVRATALGVSLREHVIERLEESIKAEDRHIARVAGLPSGTTLEETINPSGDFKYENFYALRGEESKGES